MASAHVCTGRATNYLPRPTRLLQTEPTSADLRAPASSDGRRDGARTGARPREVLLSQCVRDGPYFSRNHLNATDDHLNSYLTVAPGLQFTDPTSYQALFYFLVIKPGITIVVSLLLIILVPISFVTVLPAPAVLRLVRRLGIWQANIAVEGLCLAVR